MTRAKGRVPGLQEGYVPFANVPLRNVLQQWIEVPSLLGLLKLPAGLRILEVGCGRGVGLAVLGRYARPARLSGIDVDAQAVLEARNSLAAAGIPADVNIADLRDLPFSDGTFDIVFDFGTCYHAPHPERAVSEIQRVLGPGGRFVHETEAAQLLAHPVRGAAQRIPWESVPCLGRERLLGLWSVRRKHASCAFADGPGSSGTPASVRISRGRPDARAWVPRSAPPGSRGRIRGRSARPAR